MAEGDEVHPGMQLALAASMAVDQELQVSGYHERRHTDSLALRGPTAALCKLLFLSLQLY